MSTAKIPEMRAQLDIQFAHDIIQQALVQNIIPVGTELHASLDVLCWVLNHNYNDTFSKNLKALLYHLKADGMVVVDIGPHVIGMADAELIANLESVACNCDFEAHADIVQAAIERIKAK